jgi:hypothetical protein
MHRLNCLPPFWHSPAALKFVSFVDPAMEQDVYGDKPWALSPLIASKHARPSRLAIMSSS